MISVTRLRMMIIEKHGGSFTDVKGKTYWIPPDGSRPYHVNTVFLRRMATLKPTLTKEVIKEVNNSNAELISAEESREPVVGQPTETGHEKTEKTEQKEKKKRDRKKDRKKKESSQEKTINEVEVTTEQKPQTEITPEKEET